MVRGMSRSELASSHRSNAVFRRGSQNFSNLPGKRSINIRRAGIGDKTSLISRAYWSPAGGLIVPHDSGRGWVIPVHARQNRSHPRLNANLLATPISPCAPECGMASSAQQPKEIAPGRQKKSNARYVTHLHGREHWPDLRFHHEQETRRRHRRSRPRRQVGSGAFMKSEKEAVNLAQVMIENRRTHGQESCRPDYRYGTNRSVAPPANANEVPSASKS